MDELARETPVVVSPYGRDIFIMCGALRFGHLPLFIESQRNVAVLDDILPLRRSASASPFGRHF